MEIIVLLFAAVLVVAAGIILYVTIAVGSSLADRKKFPYVIGAGLSGVLLLSTGMLGPGIVGSLLVVAAVKIAIGTPRHQNTIR